MTKMATTALSHYPLEVLLKVMTISFVREKRGPLKRTPKWHIPLLFMLLIQLSSSMAGAIEQEGSEEYKTLDIKSQQERLKAIETRLASIKTLRTDFTQNRHMSLFMDVLSSKGILFFRKPDLLRWELTAPYKSIMIFNGGDVAKFQLKDGMLKKQKSGMEDLMRGVLEQILSMMQGDFTKVSEAYRIEVKEGNDYLLLMSPKSEGMAKAISSIELHISKATVHMKRIVIREPGEDYLEIIFTNNREESSLNMGLFNTENPDNS